jgi:hypothetical protein
MALSTCGQMHSVIALGEVWLVRLVEGIATKGSAGVSVQTKRTHDPGFMHRVLRLGPY